MRSSPSPEVHGTTTFTNLVGNPCTCRRSLWTQMSKFNHYSASVSTLCADVSPPTSRCFAICPIHVQTKLSRAHHECSTNAETLSHRCQKSVRLTLKLARLKMRRPDYSSRAVWSICCARTTGTLRENGEPREIRVYPCHRHHPRQSTCWSCGHSKRACRCRFSDFPNGRWSPETDLRTGL